ncbi:MAG TPA: LPS export ABC transporter periplasmic protein LptC [Abditibacteriaceae bacterium]|nr:LPS export ABC transporter periplasmic protein LptC [Abditibacteriaceae bacterium]
MAKFRRSATVAGVLAAVVFLGWWLWPGDEGAHRSVAPDAPAIEVEGAQSIIVREQGRKVWEFAAERIVVSANRAYVTATNVRRGVFYRDGRPYLHLRARSVRLNQQTRDLVASGTVEASGPDGFSVRTERAAWQHRLRRLQCPVAVRATLRGLTFQTSGLAYDATRGQLSCPRPVQVNSQHAVLRGVGAVVDVKPQRVEFQDGVEIVIRPGAGFVTGS